jgi:hypothetical protein
MSFPEIADIGIAIEAADLQLNKNQREILKQQSDLFHIRLGDLDPDTPEGMEIFEQTLNEVKGSWEANRLKAELTRFNLMRMMDSPQI